MILIHAENNDHKINNKYIHFKKYKKYCDFSTEVICCFLKCSVHLYILLKNMAEHFSPYSTKGYPSTLPAISHKVYSIL